MEDDEIDIFKSINQLSKENVLQKVKESLQNVNTKNDFPINVCSISNTASKLVNSDTDSLGVAKLSGSSRVLRNTRSSAKRRGTRRTTVRRKGRTKESPKSANNAIVCLDSEDDKPCVLNSVTTVDSSSDDENPEISVKFIFNNQVEAILVRKYQKFAKIFEEFASRENVPASDLVFNLGKRIVTSDDTPASLNYKIYQFIKGRIICEISLDIAVPIKRCGHMFVKIQMKDKKQPLKFDIDGADKMKILYIKCSEEINLPIEQFKLSFDGDSIQYTDTAHDIGLEGGEVIDLVIKSN